MKKYLLTTLAALFAVVSFAQTGLMKQNIAPVLETAPLAKTVKTLNPHAMAKNLKAPATKICGKKTLRRAAITDISELAGDFMVATYLYNYDSEAGKLVNATVSREGSNARIEITGDNTIAIYGIDNNASEETPIVATVDIQNSKITIPGGQTIWTYEDTLPIFMGNAEDENAEADITATIYEGGIIAIDQLWFEGYYEEGELYPNGSFKASYIAPINGVMEYFSEDLGQDVGQNVLIEQDDETKVVTVWNVHNFISGMVMDVNIYADKSFDVPGGEQVVYMHSSLNEVYLWGSPKAGSIDDIKGTVVEDVALVSTTGFGYVNASYRGWVYPNDKFTITLIDGSTFTYPEAETGELVTLPEGLTPVSYPFSYSIYVGNDRVDQTGTAKVAKSGNDFYFQGLDILIPEAWVKGTYDATTGIVSIPVTYTGNVEGTPHFYAAYGGSDGPSELHLDYDADADTYSYSATIMIYKSATATSYAYFYNGLFLGTKPSPTTAPTGLVTVDMPFKGNYFSQNAEEAEEVAGTVKVGRDGDDLYVQGLFAEDIPENWLKGTFTTIENEQYVVFRMNQYVGDLSNGLSAYLTGYLSGGDGAEGSVSDVYFLYNAEGNYYTALTPVILTRFKNSTNYTAFYQAGLTIGNAPETAINNIKDVKSDNNAWYNLNGVRIAQPTQKGLYIHNGKKVIIK